MELSSLSENIVIVPYERNGERVELSINIDAFTPEFFRAVGERFKAKINTLRTEGKKPKSKKVDDAAFFESEAQTLELNREIYADLLSNGVLVAWTVTENGLPVAPSKGVLVMLPPRLVYELWEQCLEAAKTVKKTVGSELSETPTDGVIPEATETGSPEFSLAFNAPIM